MKRFSGFLTERIDNLFIDDVAQRQKYADQVWDILQSSYKEIGGIHGSGFKDKNDMIKSLPLWKVFRRGDEVKAVVMYKDKLGRKSIAMGTDGSPETKAMVKKIKTDELKTGRSYGEVSDKALFFLIRTLREKFIDYIVPYDRAVERVQANGDEIAPKDLDDERAFLDDAITFLKGPESHRLNMTQKQTSELLRALNKNSYKRKIGKDWHVKVMVGNLNAPEVEKL